MRWGALVPRHKSNKHAWQQHKTKISSRMVTYMVEHGLLLGPFMNECKTHGMCPYVQLSNSPKGYEIWKSPCLEITLLHTLDPCYVLDVDWWKAQPKMCITWPKKYVWATPRCVFWASRLDASLNEQKANRG
jgi:hypothetical protein